MEEEVFYTIDGKEYCNEELALSILLKNDVLFCNDRQYVEFKDPKVIGGSTIVLFVLCNDIFAWGVADEEDLPLNEVGNLYRMYKKDKIWGAAKWCCFRRKQKPQYPVAEAMKKNNSWDDAMEKLQENHYDTYCKLYPLTKEVFVGDDDHDPDHKWVQKIPIDKLPPSSQKDQND